MSACTLALRAPWRQPQFHQGLWTTLAEGVLRMGGDVVPMLPEAAMGWGWGMVEEILGRQRASPVPSRSLPLALLSYFGHPPLPLPLIQSRWRGAASHPPLGAGWWVSRCEVEMSLAPAAGLGGCK